MCSTTHYTSAPIGTLPPYSVLYTPPHCHAAVVIPNNHPPPSTLTFTHTTLCTIKQALSVTKHNTDTHPSLQHNTPPPRARARPTETQKPQGLTRPPPPCPPPSAYTPEKVRCTMPPMPPACTT